MQSFSGIQLRTNNNDYQCFEMGQKTNMKVCYKLQTYHPSVILKER